MQKLNLHSKSCAEKRWNIMNILWITYDDGDLVANQFKFIIEKYTNHNVKVLSFLPPEYPMLVDIVFSQISGLNQEFTAPRFYQDINSMIKNTDFVISSFGTYDKYSSGDLLKLDGHYGSFGDMKLWIAIKDKPKIGVIFNNQSLRNNIRYFRDAYNATGLDFITFDFDIHIAMQGLAEFVQPPIVTDLFVNKVRPFYPLSVYSDRDYAISKQYKQYGVSGSLKDRLDCMSVCSMCYFESFNHYFFEALASGLPMIKVGDNKKFLLMQEKLGYPIPFMEKKDIKDIENIKSKFVDGKNRMMDARVFLEVFNGYIANKIGVNL